MEFEDKVVLITGAGRGSGRRIAETFATQGAQIAVNDISPQNVESLAADLQQRGFIARVYVDDIAKKVAVQAIINQVEEDFGRIDILINHASVEPHAALLEMDEWDWHRTLDVNLTGAFLMMQSVGRLMRSRGGGVIINMASLPVGDSATDRCAYIASLFGLIGLTRQAAGELFSYGIRVHAVGHNLGHLSNTGATVPAELSRALLFLASPKSAHLTGQIVNLP